MADAVDPHCEPVAARVRSGPRQISGAGNFEKVREGSASKHPL